MQKQNRNSQVHINGESGKTDFIIDPLLPIGKENAITTGGWIEDGEEMENLISEKLLSFVKEI